MIDVSAFDCSDRLYPAKCGLPAIDELVSFRTEVFLGGAVWSDCSVGPDGTRLPLCFFAYPMKTNGHM